MSLDRHQMMPRSLGLRTGRGREGLTSRGAICIDYRAGPDGKLRANAELIWPATS